MQSQTIIISDTLFCRTVSMNTPLKPVFVLRIIQLWLLFFYFIETAMTLSIPLIFLTLLVYVSIPELMNLLGKCLVCHLISLMVWFILLSYVYLMAGKDVAPKTCTILAYLIYIAYLSGALWLNVISFDIWLSFR